MKTITKVLFYIVTILVPLVLLLTSIRLLMTRTFLDYEYNLPNFPPDPYGFTLEERMKWGNISMDYLTNQEGDDFLSTLQFEDGTPLYNDREASHMLDVRKLVRTALITWNGLIVFLGLIAMFAWKSGNLKILWKAVSTGGWLTMGLMVLILAAVLINFNSLFTAFHGIFFEGDTWLFFTDDTLIRLYPEKLWSDAFVYMGIFTLVGASLCAFISARLASK